MSISIGRLLGGDICWKSHYSKTEKVDGANLLRRNLRLNGLMNKYKTLEKTTNTVLT